MLLGSRAVFWRVGLWLHRYLFAGSLGVVRVCLPDLACLVIWKADNTGLLFVLHK